MATRQGKSSGRSGGKRKISDLNTSATMASKQTKRQAAAPNETCGDNSKLSAIACDNLAALVSRRKMPWNGWSLAGKRYISDVNNPASTASKQTKIDEGTPNRTPYDLEPGALDQRQLDFIGHDRNGLEDLKTKLDDAIKKVRARDSADLFKLLGKVEDRLDALNKEHQANLRWTRADVLPLLDVLPKTPNTIVYPDIHNAFSFAKAADCEKVGRNLTMPSEEELIKLQRERAKQQLQSFQAAPEEGHVMTDIIHAIHATLDDSRVKPVFHALFLPESFLANRRSWSAVTAGQVDEKRSLELDFDAKKLDEVVKADANGNVSGAGSIVDSSMPSPWMFHSMLTDFAVELVNADAVMLGEGIECTKLTSIPININQGEQSGELLTRPESRGVVSNIFHQFACEPAGGSVVAITGTPGIGKSWSLFYALQQALLYDGATVLFFHQKNAEAVLYLRRNNKMYAWSSTKEKAAVSRLFKRFDVLVLLDPLEAKEGGAEFRLGEMKLLYAASNNEAHFKSAAGKNNEKIHAFLGPPLDSELPVILRHLCPSLTPDVIKERTENVGNLIRYICSEDMYKTRIAATVKAVDDCARNPKVLKKALQVKGMSDGNNITPGTLFQVLPVRPDDPGSVGYDGQGVDYRDRLLLAVNEDMRDAILHAFDRHAKMG